MAQKLKLCGAILIACMLMLAPSNDATILPPCGSVTRSMSLCVPYLTGDGTLTSACCGAIKALDNIAKTITLRRHLCICLRNFTLSLGKTVNNTDLPDKCGLHYSFNISPNIDCNQYVYSFIVLLVDSIQLN